MFELPHYLVKTKCLLIVDRVQSITGHGLRAVFSPDCVGRQTIHIHFDVGPHFALRKKLT